MISKKKSLLQKWFANERDALLAFYDKKLTLHTPILVRYTLNDFRIEVINKKLKFIDTTSYLNINEREVKVHRIFQLGNSIQKYYLLTNIGIVIARYINKNEYILTDLFLETTAGRLIFSLNFKESIQE